MAMKKKWFQKFFLTRFFTVKITQKDLYHFMKKNASDKKTLIVHSTDAPFQHFFPHRTAVCEKKAAGVELIATVYALPFRDNEFPVIVCTGLLEHLERPADAIKELHRVLKPGGKLLVSASSAFTEHQAPNDFFRYTRFGLAYLLKDFTESEIRPSCKSFTAIAILIQRLVFQTKMSKLIKVMLLISCKFIPVFNFFVKEEFGDIRKEYVSDGVLYSNIQAVATK